MTKHLKGIDRRTVLGGLAAVAAGGPAFAASPPLPTSPVVISIMDVGGALALMQKAFEDYRAANPKLVSRIAFVKAPAPELASKLKAQQDAGRVDLEEVIDARDGQPGQHLFWTGPALPASDEGLVVHTHQLLEDGQVPCRIFGCWQQATQDTGFVEDEWLTAFPVAPKRS